jgi:hypothetical protein
MMQDGREMKKFKAGDIVRGHEGDGKTWGVTDTLLLLHVYDGGSALAVVLESVRDFTGKRGRNGDAEPWTLEYRDWQKVGEVPELAAAEGAILDTIAKWNTPRERAEEGEMTTSAKPVKPEKAWAVIHKDCGVLYPTIGVKKRDSIANLKTSYGEDEEALHSGVYRIAKVTITEGWAK